jgi:hypothetical protein
MSDWVNLLSLVLAVMSAILGVFAVWLSVVFYRFGHDAQERVRSVATRVESSVELLDSHVNSLHEDTFSLIRDTVADMRSALWPRISEDNDRQGMQMSYTPDASLLTGEIRSLREALLQEISRLAVAPSSATSADLESAVDAALKRSADAGFVARDELVRSAVRECFVTTATVVASEVMAKVAQRYPFGLVIRAIMVMKESGELEWDSNGLQPTSVLRLGHFGS